MFKRKPVKSAKQMGCSTCPMNLPCIHSTQKGKVARHLFRTFINRHSDQHQVSQSVAVISILKQRLLKLVYEKSSNKPNFCNNNYNSEIAQESQYGVLECNMCDCATMLTAHDTAGRTIHVYNEFVSKLGAPDICI